MATTGAGRHPREPGQAPVHQADGRWEELLHISAQTFAERGYSATRLQDIADRFGVLKGSLYHYIRSKDDLLFEVIRSVYLGGLDNVRAIADADHPDARTKLLAIVRGHVRYVIDNLTEITVFLRDLEHLSQERRDTLPLHDYTAITTTAIAAAQSAGYVQAHLDPHLAAMTVLGAGNWVYRWFRHDGPRTSDVVVEQCADILIGGLMVEPPSATSPPTRR